MTASRRTSGRRHRDPPDSLRPTKTNGSGATRMPRKTIAATSATLAGATSGLMASMRAARRSRTKAVIRARLKEGG